MIAVVLLLVAGIGYGAYWSVSTVRASFPQTTGSLQLKGLSGPVDVKRDGYGIPQIYADTPTRTCSAPRATSRRRTASRRWTSAVT